MKGCSLALVTGHCLARGRFPPKFRAQRDSAATMHTRNCVLCALSGGEQLIRRVSVCCRHFFFVSLSLHLCLSLPISGQACETFLSIESTYRFADPSLRVLNITEDRCRKQSRAKTMGPSVWRVDLCIAIFSDSYADTHTQDFCD